MMNTLGVTHNDMLKAARAKDGKKEKKVSTKAALGKNKAMSKKGKGHKSGTDNDIRYDKYDDYDDMADSFM